MVDNMNVIIFKYGLISILAIGLYYPELHSMVSDWADKKEYSHGFLIPLISGYVMWTKRNTLRNTPITPDIKGLFVLIAGIILLLLGNVGFEPFVRRFSLIITIICLIYLILGSKMLKEMSFPVGYLLLMIPLPYIIIKTISVNLRLIDANATYSVLNFLGMPILQDGVKLELLQMSVVVADLCTGILSLVAIMAIAVLYAYLTQRHIICRLALISVAAPIAIISNMFRLIITVGLAHFYGQRVFGDVIHEFHGSVNFLITVFLVVLAGRFISKIDNRISSKREI